MTHQRLIEAIERGDGAAALALLEAEPRLCTKGDEPSAMMAALYHAQFHIAEAIADRRERLTIFEAAAIGDEAAFAGHLGKTDAATALAADGFTPLHLGCFFGREAIVRALLNAGADPDAVVEASGLRPLHSAAAGRSPAIVKALLAAGAAPDARQHGGYTPLHSAAMHGDGEMVDALLDAGADPALADDAGKSAADFARDKGHEPLAARLDAAIAGQGRAPPGMPIG